MERNTVIAVILSVVIITIGFALQSVLFPPDEAASLSTPAPGPAETTTSTPTGTTPSQAVPIGSVLAPTTGESQTVSYRNDLMEVEFDTRGAVVRQIWLLEHQDGDQPVAMIIDGGTDHHAFRLRFGGLDGDIDQAIYRSEDSSDPNVRRFTADYQHSSGAEFQITKEYRFYPGEYLVELEVSVRSADATTPIPLLSGEAAYVLQVAPQIGPTFEKLDNRNEFRKYIYRAEDKKRTINNVGQSQREVLPTNSEWAAVAGKYFALIGVPYPIGSQAVFTARPLADGTVGSQLSFLRRHENASLIEDRYLFYIGPKQGQELKRYESAADNSVGLADMSFVDVLETRLLLGWLENILKAILQLIYRAIPNYGVAIIILTIFVKLLLFPLTRKSYQSTSKMQKLQPKIQELKDKFGEDQQKLNAAMAELYKKEGVNPLGGCLPILLQFPFFLAMFGLFNNHFDLRGAVFIPGWIDNLSGPESIWNFGSFTIPLLGWNDLRLLPIIYVSSQLLSSKIMQTPQSGSNAQMKLMQYGLPLVFFFILYDMPSGLLVYWIVTNVLTAVQQVVTNRLRTQEGKS